MAVTNLLSPVDNVPGHRQHAGHPRATHHPTAHKQGCGVDGLEAENRSNVEVNRLHDILQAQRGEETPEAQTSVIHCYDFSRSTS